MQGLRKGFGVVIERVGLSTRSCYLERSTKGMQPLSAVEKHCVQSGQAKETGEYSGNANQQEVYIIASNRGLLINDQITDREIRVVDSDGSQLGIMGLRDALDRALQQNLDLVRIAPQASPPVCKIMDYGKYRFELSKKEKEARKNQKQVELKEIRLSVNIDTHDFNTKLNHTTRFLQEGHKVKVSVRFRGREMSHTSLGEARLNEFAEACKEFATIDRPPKLEGRTMAMVLNPVVSKPTKERENAQDQD